MRLWSIHPCYLDAKGLVALWREALLARKVLAGKTRSYQYHPQLIRFKKHSNPKTAIAAYLYVIRKEAQKRGYSFKSIRKSKTVRMIPVTRGQLRYEFKWLMHKLRTRDPLKHKELLKIKNIKPHPLFKVVSGIVEDWEKRNKILSGQKAA